MRGGQRSGGSGGLVFGAETAANFRPVGPAATLSGCIPAAMLVGSPPLALCDSVGASGREWGWRVSELLQRRNPAVAYGRGRGAKGQHAARLIIGARCRDDFKLSSARTGGAKVNSGAGTNRNASAEDALVGLEGVFRAKETAVCRSVVTESVRRASCQDQQSAAPGRMTATSLFQHATE